jgi:hypothetical protein
MRLFHFQPRNVLPKTGLSFLACRSRSLFMSMFLGMSLSRFFGVAACVSGVALGRMGVMGRLLVIASFVRLAASP